MLTYLLLSQTLTPLLLEIVKLTTHNNLSFALKEGNFFPKKVFTSASHAESSLVGASDMSHGSIVSICVRLKVRHYCVSKEYVFLSTYSRPPFLMTKGRSKSQFWLLQKEESQD